MCVGRPAETPKVGISHVCVKASRAFGLRPRDRERGRHTSQARHPRKEEERGDQLITLNRTVLHSCCQVFWSSSELAESRAYISINTHMRADHGHC